LAGLRRLPAEISAFFVSVAVYFILVSGGPIATARYRSPFMPLICISAGVAIANWPEKSKSTIAKLSDLLTEYSGSSSSAWLSDTERQRRPRQRRLQQSGTPSSNREKR